MVLCFTQALTLKDLKCYHVSNQTNQVLRYVTKKVSRCFTIPLTRSLSPSLRTFGEYWVCGCKEAPRLLLLGASSLSLQFLCGLPKQKLKHQWKAELCVSRMTPEPRSRTTGSRAIFLQSVRLYPQSNHCAGCALESKSRAHVSMMAICPICVD
ncbi:hypothetical protein ASPFODRAFT_615024 [Aspergillus luchuensis CBS 106.47]|uniref:Uncharacterized protein n=1 Tax=Aspergillus luchuensis (strain CBS 106.47) TaxID=1137211 RepID=A0A1M3TJJ8_ASPLC|nr:hypothetical protein ASPFODRAFT_615024 [Aspergillus luchuensis CBS 106.47]